MFFVFCLPENGHNPPPLSVIEQLNAVDSASERLGIILRVSRLVGAPYVRDAVPMLDLVRDGAFKEAFFGKYSLAAGNIIVSRQHAGGDFSLVILARRHETRAWIEQ